MEQLQRTSRVAISSLVHKRHLGSKFPFKVGFSFIVEPPTIVITSGSVFVCERGMVWCEHDWRIFFAQSEISSWNFESPFVRKFEHIVAIGDNFPSFL